MNSVKKPKGLLKFKPIRRTMPEVAISCWSCKSGNRGIIAPDGMLYCHSCGAINEPLKKNLSADVSVPATVVCCSHCKGQDDKKRD